MTGFWAVRVFVSRHNFGVAIVVLHCGFSYVSRHDFLCRYNGALV